MTNKLAEALRGIVDPHCARMGDVSKCVEALMDSGLILNDEASKDVDAGDVELEKLDTELLLFILEGERKMHWCGELDRKLTDKVIKHIKVQEAALQAKDARISELESRERGEFAQNRGFEDRGPQAIIKFADPDVRDMYFHEEDAIETATQYWHLRKMNWNCSLFLTPRISSLSHENPDFLEGLNAKVDEARQALKGDGNA